MDDLSFILSERVIGCHIDDLCINHVFYVDDLCLMALCAIALQELIALCYEYSIDIDLNFNETKSYCVAFTLKLYKLALPSLHICLAIVHQLSYDSDHQLETRMIKFVHLCLNHSNHVCRLIILSSKLHCIKSTFASNYMYKYLSYRYNISHDDWNKDISHLIIKIC